MSTQRRAELLLLAATVVWGSTFVVTKSLLEEHSPHLYSALRFLLATAMMGAVIFRRLGSISGRTYAAGTVLGVLLYVGFILQTVGLQYTTASKSAFFTGLLTVFTPVVHFAGQRVLRLRPSALRAGNVLGVALAAVGLWLLTSPAGGGFNRGDAMTVACAACFAFFIVYLDYVSDLPDKMALTLVQFAVCGLLAVLGTLISGEEVRIGLTAEYAAALLYLTIFATVITMAIQVRFQGDTTPTRAAVIFSLEPVVAALFAAWIRSESLGGAGIAGGGLILGGVIFSELSDQLPFLRRTLLGPPVPDAKNGQYGQN